MSGLALERVFREASGRIVAALAARFRDLSLAEDSCAEACVRALQEWPRTSVPQDPAAWLYSVAFRVALDALRHHRTQQRLAPLLSETESADPVDIEDTIVIPDERLRLIFVCCHPAVSPEARAALTLRLVCGLSAQEIARAFLLPEATLHQRLTRAKRKVVDAGIPFEVPGPEYWPERLEAVLSTLEIAYAKAYEDAAGSGVHAHFAAEVLHLSRVLAQLMPAEAEVLGLAALVRFAEARRIARVSPDDGLMIPLSEQDPSRWNRSLIDEGMEYLSLALRLDSGGARVIQAQIHATWCERRSLTELAPWPAVLRLYDRLVAVRDNPITRLNRAVAVAEVQGVAAAVAEVEALDAELMRDFAPYYAIRADLLRRAGQLSRARNAYDEAIGLVSTQAERAWLTRQREQLGPPVVPLSAQL